MTKKKLDAYITIFANIVGNANSSVSAVLQFANTTTFVQYVKIVKFWESAAAVFVNTISRATIVRSAAASEYVTTASEEIIAKDVVVLLVLLLRCIRALEGGR